MSVLFWSAGLFLLAFLVHLVIWRRRAPRAPRKLLLLLFGGVLFAGLASAAALGHRLPEWLVIGHPARYLLAAAVYVSVFLAYVALYTALEGDSPSLSMVRYIHAAGSAGLPEEELRRRMVSDRFVRSRMGHLLADDMARLEGERYVITAKGAGLLSFYTRYARLARQREKTT